MEAELFPGKTVKVDPASFMVGGSWQMDSRYECPMDYKTIQYLYEKTKGIEDAVMVDIGANTGSYCLIPSFNTNIKKVICIEPNIFLLSILRNNLAFNNIPATIEWAAVSDHYEKVVPFMVRVGMAGQGSTKDITVGPGIINFNVELLTLDSIIKDRLDILKVDAEGCDLEVIRGGLHAIEKYKPDILIEYEQIKKKDELFKMLCPLGYTYKYVDTMNVFFTTREQLDNACPCCGGKYVI